MERALAFVAGDQPVTAEQVLKSLQNPRLFDVQGPARAISSKVFSSKNGKTAKVVVDARTGCPSKERR